MYNKIYKEIEVELVSSSLTIHLNSPQNHNALSTVMINELIEVLRIADCDREVRVIILGARGKSFCAGGDVKAMKNKTGMFSGESNELRLLYTHGIQMIPRTIEALETPIIAMVGGAAVGAGMDLSCMCDFRVCSTRAKFKGSFTKLGLVPGDGGTYFLSRLVGHAKALEIYLINEFISAEEALSFNMVTKVVSAEDLESETYALARKISKNAPIANALTKKAIKAAPRESLDLQLDRLSSYQSIAQRTADHFEGVDALLAKREPEFNSH